DPGCDVPTQHDVPRRLAVLGGEGHDRGMVQQIGPGTQWPPRDGDDPLRAVVGTLLRSRDMWVELNLVDRGSDAGIGQQALDVCNFEIGDADRSRLAGCDKLFEGLPG